MFHFRPSNSEQDINLTDFHYSRPSHKTTMLHILCTRHFFFVLVYMIHDSKQAIAQLWMRIKLSCRITDIAFSQTSSVFYLSAVQVFKNPVGKGEIARNFSHCFLPNFKNFLTFSSNLKLSSVNSFSLVESKICCFGKG